MFHLFELFIGLRYVRAERRNHFISFISFISISGVSLGVMALIVVLSVMNGFEKELKERILGMASHATIMSLNDEFQDWRSIMEIVRLHKDVMGVAPFHRAEGMLVNGKKVQGTLIRGILPEFESKVSEITDKIELGDFASLKADHFNIILGAGLARALQVTVGDTVTLVTPQVDTTPIGIIPRLKRFNVTGLFRVGMYEFDSALALIHLDSANKLFRRNGPSALRLKTTDILHAPMISRIIQQQLPGDYRVVDWTQRYANFFRALKTEKTVMFVILTLIVTVAAFNIISMLVMMVADKRADIAILRTLGARPADILKIFIIQGVTVGVAGIIAGIIFGVLIATHIETLVPAIEAFFEVKLLPQDIYYISDLPSHLSWRDVFIVGAVSFFLCIVATIYPALRAAKIQPAEVLRYE